MAIVIQTQIDSPGPRQSRGLGLRMTKWLDLAELLKPSKDQLPDFMTGGFVLEHLLELPEQEFGSLTDQLLLTVLAHSIMATGELRVLIQMITLNTHQNHWNPLYTILT